MNRFRKIAASIVLALLLSVLLLAFVFSDIAGVSSALRMAGADATVSRIGGVQLGPFHFGGTQIKGRELREEYNRQYERLNQQFRGQLTNDAAIAMGLPIQALRTMEERMLFDRAIADAGIVVTDAQLRAAVEREPAFQADGKFSPVLFRAVLQQNRVPEAIYLQDKRREMAATQLVGAVMDAAATPKPLREALFRYRNEHRIAETLTLEAARVADPPAPSDDQLKAFYDKTKSRFQVAERRSLSYVMVEESDVLELVNITEDMLKQAYEERLARYARPEKRVVDQVVVAEEDKAKAIAAAMAGGKSLEDASKEVLQRDGAVVALGGVEERELPPDLAKAIFALKEPGAVAPVKTPLGWHVARVTKIEPGEKPTFESLKARIEADMRKELAGEVLGRLVSEFDRELGKADNLEAAAEAAKLKLHKVDSVDQRGFDANGRPAVSGEAATDMLATAWSMTEGKTGAIKELRSGAFYVVRVDKVTPASIPPLEAVKAKVVVAWTEAERQKAAEAQAKSIVDKLGAVTDLSTQAHALKLTVKTSKAVGRRDRDEANGLTAAAVTALFKLKPGEATVVPVTGGAMIVRLKEIVAADPAKEAVELQRLDKELDSVTARAMRDAYVQMLEKRYGVVRNSEALAAVFRPGEPQQ
ncbi:MAG: peptidyl-prolyl cis-trans isomerase [Reyranellaceae bacterium]